MKRTLHTVALAYASYLDKTGEAFVSQARIAESAGLRRETVNRCFRDLVDLGWLEKRRQQRRGRGNVYRATIPAWYANGEEAPSITREPEPVPENFLKADSVSADRSGVEAFEVAVRVGVSDKEGLVELLALMRDQAGRAHEKGVSRAEMLEKLGVYLDANGYGSRGDCLDAAAERYDELCSVAPVALAEVVDLAAHREKRSAVDSERAMVLERAREYGERGERRPFEAWLGTVSVELKEAAWEAYLGAITEAQAAAW